MLVGQLRPRKYSGGCDIITEGGMGEQLFIVEKGVCDVIKTIGGKQTVVLQLKKGAYFGEIAVMYDVPRTATVRAATEVSILSIDRTDLVSTIGKDKLDRMRHVARVQLFETIPLLRNLPLLQKRRIADLLKPEIWDRGQVILSNAKRTRRLYILEQGQCQLSTTPATSARKADPEETYLSPGQYFGQAGFLYDQPLLFKVTAWSPEAKTLSVSREDVLSLVGVDEQPNTHRIMQDSVRMHQLKALPVLRDQGDDIVKGVLHQSEEVNLRRGEVLFGKGANLEAIYLLEFGEVCEADCYEHELRDDGRGKPHESAVFHQAAGQTFPLDACTGEDPAAILSRSPPTLTHTLTAASDCTFMKVRRNSLMIALKKTKGAY